jgi:long-chain acyl-CoA synthetase
MTEASEASEPRQEDDGGMAAAVGIKVIQSLVFVYDFITFPLYYAIQQPWKATEAMASVRSEVIERTKTSVTYKPIFKTSPELESFQAAGIETMNECFDLAVKRHSHQRMVGTRQVLSEEDEVQPNGKLFKKWDMGEYRWQTYLEVDEMATNFGKGLRELGLDPLQRIAIFAETKADWLVCAIGCFKQTFPLVTLYANLGDDAIVHGVNETEVTHVITTHELMPKFKNVLQLTPSVKHLIFLEDQINTTDQSGYMDGVQIHAFQKVINLGRKSTNSFKMRRPTKDDPAIIMYTSGSTGVPKGVVLPHESLVSTLESFHFVVHPVKPGDIYLGYLPLAHILELLSEFIMIVQGIPVGYSSPNTMIDTSTKLKKGCKGDCTVLKPSLMCAVPLVIDRIYKGIQTKVSKRGPFFRQLLDFCYRYKSYYRKRGMYTPILDAVIFKNMRAIVGGRIRFLLSGGAPLSPDTHDYVRCALSLPLVQGYGLTESCACATIMDNDDWSTGSAGPPLQGVMIKLINWEEGNYRVTDEPNPRGTTK